MITYRSLCDRSRGDSKEQVMGHYSTQLVCVSHFENAIGGLVTGDLIVLIQEPESPHDANAARAAPEDESTAKARVQSQAESCLGVRFPQDVLAFGYNHAS